MLLTSVKVFIVNILDHSFIGPVQTSLHWQRLLRISTSFTEKFEERSLFLRLITTYSLIGLLITQATKKIFFQKAEDVGSFKLKRVALYFIAGNLSYTLLN